VHRQGHDVNRGTGGDRAGGDELERLRQGSLTDSMRGPHANTHARHAASGGPALDRAEDVLAEPELMHER